jgi:hypothetical protein
MLKFLVFAGLVLLVLYVFAVIGRRRPPGDWDRDGDKGGPVRPSGRIRMDDATRGDNPWTPSMPEQRPPEKADAGSDDSQKS